MALLAYISFSFKNYLRQHRYLRELIAVVVFSIFFGGFLTTDHLQDNIWMVFTVFAIILNLLTAPSLFFLESGNELHFLLAKPDGRRRLFLSKIIVIILIDLFWVLAFAVLYGLRFMVVSYFYLLPLRMGFIAMVLCLSTLLLSFAFTYHPRLSWLIFILLIFGNITHKTPLLSLESISDLPNLLIFLLPPFFELNAVSISLDISGYNLLFILLAVIQMGVFYFLSRQRMMKKDLL